MASIDFTHGKGRRLPATLLGIIAIIALLAIPSAAPAQSTAGSNGSFDVGNGLTPGGTGSDDSDAAADDASTPTGDQYNDTPHRIQFFTTGSSGSSGGGLPFTGFDVGLVAAIGAALLGAGFLIRRLGRERLDA